MGLFSRNSDSDKSPGFRDHKTLGGKVGAVLVLLWKSVLFPFRAFWSAGAFTVKHTRFWWKDRQMKHLLRGLPTLLLGGLCLYYLIGMRSNSGFVRAEKYLAAGKAAYQAEQWETAKLYLERAIVMGLKDNDTMFELARSAQETSDTAKMVAILEELAPTDRAVYLPAHFWMATQILTSGPVKADQVETARAHLKHVLTLNPDHTGANAVLGDMYFQQKLWNAAIQHLEKAHPQNARYRLLLAKACLYAGDRTRATKVARDAQQEAQRRSTANPENIDDRLLWGDATTLLEEFEEAESILLQGLTYDDNERLRLGLTRVYIFWADSIEGNSEEDALVRFKLLAKGMEYNPNDVFLFDRFMRILERRGKAADDAKAFLYRGIVEGDAHGDVAGICHLLLGTAGWIEQDEQKASVHLERAFALLPQATTVANNFAWYLASKDPPEPERALKMIVPVLARTPDNHYVRDTRGHIYLKLGRWKEAVDDLEYALQELRTNNETHLALSTAYRELGLTELAEEHAKAAKTLAERTAP